MTLRKKLGIGDGSEIPAFSHLSDKGQIINEWIETMRDPQTLQNIFQVIENFGLGEIEKKILNKKLADKINNTNDLPQFNESGLLIKNGDVLTFWLRYGAVKHWYYLTKLGYTVEIRSTGKDYTICKTKKSFQPEQGLSRCFE